MGALISAVLAGLTLSWMMRHGHERADTAMGALWTTGMAVGLLFIAATPAYVEPMSYLFGNVLMVGDEQLLIACALDIVLLVVLVLFRRALFALSLDEDFARLRGIPTGFFHALMTVMIALAVVMLVQVIGVVLVIALLTLPAAIAGRFTRRLLPMMSLAVLLSAFLQSSGLLLSYYTDTPSGAMIALVCASAYGLAVLFKR